MPSVSTQPELTSKPARSIARNPYLQGNYAPVPTEVTVQDLAVDGELPRELNGLLLRDGPNPIGIPGEKHHWFVGDAMLHALEISDGRARSYRNRFVRTAHVEATLALPAAARSKHPLPMQGSGNVHVIEHAGRILALAEVGYPYELTRQLETRGEYDFAGALESSMTAHPKIDPVTGELLFFGYDFGAVHLRYHRASADGKLTSTIPIATAHTTMMHDFGVTETRVVFMDLPVVFELELVAQGYGMPFQWRPEHGARLGILPRAASRDETRWIEIDPCYVFHVLNTYDQGQEIVMDVVRYERMFDRERRGPFEDQASKLVRWTIDPAAGSVKETLLDATAQEFPRLDPRRAGQPHRFGYALQLELSGDHYAQRGLLKHDFVSQQTQAHDVGPGRAASEGVFVPAGEAEDAGYVIAPVYDANTGKSDVIVLDARNFSAPPLATIHLPVRIPFGFHGSFVSLG
jgi:carotenoid cleavage dioxygenase-like enzyme